jgi:predicted GTPase
MCRTRCASFRNVSEDLGKIEGTNAAERIRSVEVAIVGKPNVGKSTLLEQACRL